MSHGEKTAILLLVHPGSACGSANMSLGHRLASACRESLAADIASWNGPFFVIDGFLSDEVPAYPMLQEAIDSALARASSDHHVHGRIWGCDNIPPHQDAAVRRIIRDYGLTSEAHSFTVTGASTSSDGRTGCVDDVYKRLKRFGFNAEIRDSAVPDLPDHNEEEN